MHKKRSTIGTVTIVNFAMIFCIVPNSEAQPGGQDRERVTRDFFGPREGFRQPESESRRRHPVVVQRFRTIDGSQNNLGHESWGKAFVNLRRRSPSDYADGISAPSGETRISAREISNLIFDQEDSIENRRGLSSMVWQWGQFLDHDIDLTESADPPEAFFIDVPVGDIFFDPFGTGDQQIQLFRSHYRHGNGPRQQINQITSWIDGSNVYGSDDATARNLRTLSGGLMKQSAGGLLPIGDDGFFLAGDIRANEQLGLICMHTLFVREHNRIARRFAARNPRLSDEQVYLRARQRVIGIIQSITYNEFLPLLLGENSIPQYRGYNSRVNPNITNVFSTAAYRFGHTMLPSELLRVDNNGNEIEAGNVAMRDAFFNPGEIVEHGIDSVVKGLTLQTAQENRCKSNRRCKEFSFRSARQRWIRPGIA